MITVPQREAKRALLDAFLTLCVAATMGRRARQPGKTLFHKILFAIRVRRGEKSLPGYSFIRHHYGPFSPDLAQDLEALAVAGLLRQGALDVTDRGLSLVVAYRPDLERANRALFRAMDEEATKRAGWSAERAKQEAYEHTVRVPGSAAGKARDVKLRDLPQGVAFRFADIVVAPFKAPESLLEELALDLSMSADQVRRAATFTPESTAGVRQVLAL